MALLAVTFPIFHLAQKWLSFIDLTFKEKLVDYLKRKWIKLVWVLFVFVGFLIVKFSGVITEADYTTIKDKLFDATEGINDYINENHKFAHAWEIIAWLNLDIVFLLTWYVFVTTSKTFRTLIAILLFYGIRAVLQQFQTLPFPKGIYWENPGFPSLVNIYGKQSDFFYSGHIGFILLCTIEFFVNGFIKIGIFGTLSTIHFFFVLLCFREHYTIDLFTGLIMGHYWYFITGFFIKYLDKYLMKKDEFGDSKGLFNLKEGYMGGI